MIPMNLDQWLPGLSANCFSKQQERHVVTLENRVEALDKFGSEREIEMVRGCAMGQCML